MMDEMEVAGGLPPVKPIHIDVIATHLGGDKFDYCVEIKDHAHNDKGKIKTHNKLGCELRFTLVREPQANVRFNASAPFSVWESGKPDTAMGSEQILVDSCSADRLVIIDWNFGEPMELRYELNFTTLSGLTDRERCDPVIQNTGGAIKPT